MALTSLEAIAEKLKEKKDAELESILKISGSAAITRNEYGVTMVTDDNYASSLVFKSLTKNKIDNEELLKAIDTEVKELRPDIPVANLDLVPRQLYTDKVTENENLTIQVRTLTAQVDDLSSQVVSLKGEVQTEINNRLAIEQTNDALANQLETLTGTIQDFSNQIQSAVQKSIDEAVLRASLQSQNQGYKAQIEALIKQIDSLNSIIEGLQSQLGAVQQQQAIQQGTQAQAMAAGADVIGKSVILQIAGPTEDKNVKLGARGRASSEAVRWDTGGLFKFTNNDKNPVTITFSHVKPKGLGNNPDFLVFPQNPFTLAAGESKDIQATINHNAGTGLNSKKKTFGYSGTSDYPGGELTVKVKTADGKEESKKYSTRFKKTHPDSFG
jgi:chaperonin cofactor prefoldin